ncbi:MAG: hypothetical protein U0M92_03270 [Bacilli bacterium]
MNDNLENNLGDSVSSENNMNGLNASQPNEMVNGNTSQQNVEQLNTGEPIETPNLNNDLNNNISQMGTNQPTETINASEAGTTNQVGFKQPEVTNANNNMVGSNYPGVDPNTQNNINSNNNLVNNSVKKKNKGLIIVLVIAIVVLLIVVGGFVYIKSTYNAKSFLNKNAKNIIASIDKSFDALSINDDLIDNFDKYDMINDTNITLTTSSTTLKSLNNLQINLNEKSNINDNYLSLDLGLKQNNESIKGTVVYNNNKIYLNSKDIFDSPLYTTLDENIFANTKEYVDMVKNFSNINDLENSMKNIVKYVASAIEQANMNTKTSGLNITYTYEINEKNYNKVIDKFIELVKNDKIIMSYLENDTSILDSLKDSPINIVFEITIKALTNEVQSFVLDVEGSKLEGTKVEKNKYKIVGEDTELYLECKDDVITITEGTNKISIEVSNKKLGLAANVENSIIELALQNDKKNSTITANIDIEGVKVNCNVKVKEDSKNNKSDATGKIDVTYNNENIVIDFTNKMEYGKNKITKSDITNAKNFEQLADSETSTIMLNLYSKLGAFDFFKDISSIIGNIDEPNYSEDDYDFGNIEDNSNYNLDNFEF